MYILAGGFTAENISEEIRQKIEGVSYHKNDKIKLSDLAYLKVKHINFSGEMCIGELICNKKVAKELLEIFYQLYQSRYPIEKIRLVDEYGADDDKVMSDNNSSCLTYRVIADTNVISMHGLGRAVDINPLYNPYIVGNKVMPGASQPYADRSKNFEHKIDENDLCCKIFTKHGWKWGGHWKNSKDYQHFYKADNRIKRLVNKLKRKDK